MSQYAHLNFPYLGIMVSTAIFLLLLVFYRVFTVLFSNNHHLSEDDIIGTWKDESGEIIIKFYRTANQSYEAKLVVIKKGNMLHMKDVVVVKELKYTRGTFNNGEALSKRTGDWLCCTAILENEDKLIITCTRALLKKSRIWYRLQQENAG